jgi:tetratricopeptide (TPR) repeat protein
MIPKRILISLLIQLSITFYFSAINVTSVYAQIPGPPLISPNGNSPQWESKIMEIEKRVFQLETNQSQQLSSLNSSNDQYRWLITAITALLGALAIAGGAFQVFVTRSQMRREEKQDEVQHSGVKQVSDVMSVVQHTLETRLDAEKQARDEAKKTRTELDKVLNNVKSIEIFVQNFQSNITTARQAIEDSASRLTQIPRHDFKSMTNDLNNFAGKFDSFKTEYEPLEAKPARLFSSKVSYIRGIAAHYANTPDIAKQYLNGVIGLQQAEAGDTDKAFKRRLANAFYYLGITELNFGNTQDALDAFEQANHLDPESTDFLTKVVTAEAYTMKGIEEFKNIENLLSGIEGGLNRKKDKEGRLAGVYLRLQSRTSLVRVNMLILKRDGNWLQEAEKLLKQVYTDNPSYYFATATLAQIYLLQGNLNEARKMFRETYEVIEHSGDLLTVVEIRSIILLQMVAGLCCLHGLENKKRSDEHLDMAESLRNSLPKIGSQGCTVFSTITKRNENSEIIHQNIELIRNGEVLV